MALLPERMRLLRKEKGLIQEVAAREIGIVLRSYMRYEKGEREPVASTLMKMADFYGVTTDYLLGRTDKRN